MGFFSKLAHGVSSFVQKGASGVEHFASKAGDVVHSINQVADKVANSGIGKALLDAIPEGHNIYNAVRGGTGALEKTAHNVSSLARGVKNIAGAKDLQTGLRDASALAKRGKDTIREADNDYRQTRSELERTTKPLREKMSRHRGGSRHSVGGFDTGGNVGTKRHHSGKHRKRKKKRG